MNDIVQNNFEEKAKELKKKLYWDKKNVYDVISKEEEKNAYNYCENYKKYLDMSKTERLCVNYTEKTAKDNGFVEFHTGMTLKSGDKVYFNNRGKSIILVKIGSESNNNGAHICAAHIDSPRIDLKQNPLYEDSDMAFFKTKYYGGIKKYQWVTMPLVLYGTVVLKDLSKIDIAIGDDENDPVFCITDLLPHLAKDQMSKNMKEGINAETMNIIIGSTPFGAGFTEISDRFKLNILNILNEKYGMSEEDFLSAEIEAVPLYNARDIGFDRSLIGAYGHDDRVCAYPSLTGILECGVNKKTAICMLVDKEEIGSNGNTGMQSDYLKHIMYDIAKATNTDPVEFIRNSKVLSADVNAAYDPNFPEVSEKRNAAQINYGIVMTKYTGSGGKSGTSDASAEYVGYVRKIFNDAGVEWQIGELGKTDQGGGGTVAKYMAQMDMDVVDVGVPVLSMHAPYEIVSKLDVYYAHMGMKAFYMA